MGLFNYLWSNFGQQAVLILLVVFIMRAWHQKKNGEIIVLVIIAAVIWIFGSNPTSIMDTLSAIIQKFINALPH